MNAGTHLDTASDNGETFLILLKKNMMRSKQKVIINPYYESLLNTVFHKKEPVLSADSQRLAMDCSKLMLQLDRLFNGMQFSDVMFNTRPRISCT